MEQIYSMSAFERKGNGHFSRSSLRAEKMVLKKKGRAPRGSKVSSIIFIFIYLYIHIF